MRIAAILGVALGLMACGPSKERTPSGTPSDPVEVCTRLADVCRYDGSQLGVCSPGKSETGYVCMPQH